MPYGKYTKLKNYDNVIAGLTGISNKIIKALGQESYKITEYMESELKKDIAVVDEHDLSELAKMGHPYATRGMYSNLETKQTQTRAGVPHSEPVIHSQKGKLLISIKSSVILNKDKSSLRVYINPEDVPYIRYLIHGTSKMVARPVFQYTWSRIREKCLTDLESSFAKHGIKIRRKF